MHLALINLTALRPPRVLPLPQDGGKMIVGRVEPWRDTFLTRESAGGHVEVWREGERWMVRRVSAKPNPLYFDAARTRQMPEPFAWEPGVPLFVGRGGTTVLVLVNHADEAHQLRFDPLPDAPREKAESDSFRIVQEKKAEEAKSESSTERLPHAVRLQLKVLREELPQAIEHWLEKQNAEGAWTQRGEEDLLFDAVAGMLRQTLSGGGDVAVAFVAVDAEKLEPVVLNDDPSPLRPFRVSRGVLRQLLEHEAGRAFLFSARSENPSASAPGNSLSGGPVDWALALQLKGAGGGEQSAPLVLRGKRIVLYVDAVNSSRPAPPELLPFLRTVGVQVACLIEARELQRRQTQLARYFSPRLRREVMRQEGALEPAEFLCTVLFCDRRGSSRAAEAAREASGLLEKLRENQQVLGRVTQVVFDNDGAVADFAGDAVLGFWGWPPDERAGDHAMLALNAARRIAESLGDLLEFDEERQLRLPAFRIGISTGRMAVGNVDFAGQMKIGVFGGPVNFGSRLEGLGKMFRVPVIVSEETRRAVQDRDVLLRRLCLIRPQGFDDVYPIYELVLPRDLGGSGASVEQVRIYEEALEHFTSRRWQDCIKQLGTLVASDDEGAHWLMEQAMTFRKNPPGPDWKGEVSMTVK